MTPQQLETGGPTTTLDQSQTTQQQQQQQQQQQIHSPSHLPYNAPDDLNDSTDLDQVLEREEEIMGDDEEINSYDEDGQPIVDLDQIDRRNLTVALVKSVVDTTSANPSSTARYGLRRRRHSNSPETPDSHKHQSNHDMMIPTTVQDPTQDLPQQPLHTTLPPTNGLAILRKPLPLMKPPLTILQTNEITSASTSSSTTTGGVPNPLLNMLPSPAMLPVETPTQPMMGPSIVPCPLLAPVKNEVLGMPRGRIFSIDIDPAGLDFPDMGMEVLTAQPDFTGSSILPPILTFSSAPNCQPPPLMPPPSGRQSNAVPSFISSSDMGGRDRAMSFEFFSFGLNADEPLPPINASGDTQIVGRPRGDSIIFDPISFREGGIHEEKALLRSRTNSLELDELAIMNSPGFAPQQTAIKEEPMSVPSSLLLPAAADSQMATLPSSLNNSMNHATFQMDLLNKDGRIGIYLPDSRKARIAKFHSKRKMRIWRKRIKYDCRKKLADSRPRIKGRFVKRTDMDDDEE